jgi:ketosteroid isomerase-like protein
MNAQIAAGHHTDIHHDAAAPERQPVAAPLLGALLLAATGLAQASPDEDRAAVAALDTQYQAAVERNDAETMDRILAKDFVLVTGVGKTYDRDDLLEQARTAEVTYERQVEVEGTQIVRVYGDTAIVTALLWLKGTQAGRGAFDYKLWFSDTYVRTPQGWRYFFGQAAQPIPSGS